MDDVCNKINENKDWLYWSGNVYKWLLNIVLFYTVLIAENESGLQKLVDVFDSMCKRQKLVNLNKSRVEFESS